MNLELAKSSFLETIQNLNDFERPQFVKWLKTDILDRIENEPNQDVQVVEGRLKLLQIAEELKQRLPLEATLSSESFNVPDEFLNQVQGKQFIHLDAFLYDEADEQQLEDEGKLKRYFCMDCSSKNTVPLDFITHSCSRKTLEFMFTSLLPPLEGKRVLDVGSRLGAVLYGAFYFSNAKEIVGIEINKDFCDLSQTIIESRQMTGRIQILNSELTTVSDLVSSANVIILNNVFDWFMPKETQKVMWQFLYKTISKGALIVSSPSIPEALEKIEYEINLDQWLRKLNPTRPSNCTASEVEEESQDFHLYQVL